MEWRVVVELASVAGAVQTFEAHAGGSATDTGYTAATLGLTLAEAKLVLAGVQRHLARAKPRSTAKRGGAARDAGDSDR